MAGQPHHKDRRYVLASARIRAAANANPNTRCWRCGLTLAEHPNTKTGKPPRWTAGHIVDGDLSAGLRPEVDVCNYQAGAAAGNRNREPHSELW
jgi:hypothetical protein